MSSKGVAPPNGAATLYKPTGLRPGGSAPPRRELRSGGSAPQRRQLRSINQRGCAPTTASCRDNKYDDITKNRGRAAVRLHRRSK
jgi:hypothetical protein